MDAEIIEVLKVSGVPPIEDWAGDCHRVALALAEHYGGAAQYGIYHGDIEDESMFSGRGPGLVRHGWIELPDGSVVDPTRWVFEFARDDYESAYIWTGPGDDYDVGGGRLNQAVRRMMGADTVPEHDPSQPVEITFPSTVSDLVAEKIGPPPYSFPRIHYLLHLPPTEFFTQKLAADVYRAAKAADLEVLIPIDFLNWAGV